MKLTKENIYIDLRGKSKEELTDIQSVLIMFNEPTYRKDFETYYNSDSYNYLEFYDCEWLGSRTITETKQEVTIEQLKEILQPMETLEQKLRKEATERGFVNGVNFYGSQGAESTKPMLINDSIKFTNSYNWFLHVNNSRLCFNGKWGTLIEETLEQQLEKAKAEVKRIEDEIEEQNKPKVGDLVIFERGKYKVIFELENEKLDRLENICGGYFQFKDKITDQELINKLNELTK